MIEFTTQAERRRKERKEKTVSDFLRYKKETGYANCRIIQAMADCGECGYRSFNSIRNVLINAHVI